MTVYHNSSNSLELHVKTPIIRPAYISIIFHVRHILQFANLLFVVRLTCSPLRLQFIARRWHSEFTGLWHLEGCILDMSSAMCLQGSRAEGCSHISSWGWMFMFSFCWVTSPNRWIEYFAHLLSKTWVFWYNCLSVWNIHMITLISMSPIN